MFDGYVCAITGLPCCGCSLFCEHRVVGNFKALATKLATYLQLPAEVCGLPVKAYRFWTA